MYPKGTSSSEFSEEESGDIEADAPLLLLPCAFPHWRRKMSNRFTACLSIAGVIFAVFLCHPVSRRRTFKGAVVDLLQDFANVSAKEETTSQQAALADRMQDTNQSAKPAKLVEQTPAANAEPTPSQHAALQREWDRMIHNATNEWPDTLQNEWADMVDNASYEWTRIARKRWHSIAATENATGEWTEAMHEEWNQVLNTSKWSHSIRDWWDVKHPLQETLEREQELQQKLEQTLRTRVGDLANQTSQFTKHRFSQQMKHALQHSWDSVGNMSMAAEEWRGEIRGIMKMKEGVNGSTSTECPDLDGLYIDTVLHNNLGGQGPDAEEESLIFASNLSEGGVTVKRLALKVTATSPYSAGWCQMNGLSHGLVGKYGQVTLRPGTNVSLRIQTFDLDTGLLVSMRSAALTFFDLDEDVGREASEFVRVGGFDAVELAHNTEVRSHKNADRTTTFQASTQGTFEDNPIDPLLFTTQQKNRAVTVKFSDVDEIRVVIGASAAPSDAGSWRCFTFVAHPVLKCAKILDAQRSTFKIPQLPVPILLAGLLFLGLVGCMACCCCFA
mmetsp:Transcript_78963/g.183173  ORF Transcript_78963/g.183173 Transcript_78963/m.183173 type:complete len:558 (+) Transcript_78963:75-1748(+)